MAICFLTRKPFKLNNPVKPMSQRPKAGYQWLERNAEHITGTVLNCGSGTDEQNVRSLFTRARLYRDLDINPLCLTEVVADLQNMPSVPSSSEDCIIAHRVMEQIKSPESAIKEFYRVLKPNGILLISFAGPAYDDERFHKFVEGEAKALLEKVSFKIESLETLYERINQRIEHPELSATYIRARK